MLTADERLDITSDFTLHTFSKGEELDFGSATKDDVVYLVAEGRVRIQVVDESNSNDSSTGEHVHLSTLTLGHIVLRSPASRTVLATALCHTKCLVLRHDKFVQLPRRFKGNVQFVEHFEAIYGTMSPGAPSEDDGADSDALDTQARIILTYVARETYEHNERVSMEVKADACAGCCTTLFSALGSTARTEFCRQMTTWSSTIAQQRAVLEVVIVVYAPASLQAMLVLFCSNVGYDSYPPATPTIDCSSVTHKRVQYFGRFL